MHKLSKTLLSFSLPAVVLASAGAWYWGNGATIRTPGITFDTVTVTKGPIRKLVSTSGPVRALITVSVGTQLSGQVLKLEADFNSEVKENDILAILDDKTFVAKVAQAKADLATAKAQLANAVAAAEKSEAVMRQAGRSAGRQQTLAQKGIAATATLDTAMRDMEVAKADIGVAKAQIASAKAQVEQREAQLLQAEIDLDRTRIRSPINGTVISRTIDIGQTVAASLQAPELFKIAQDLRRIRLEAQVNEADVGSVQEGNTVEFVVDAYPERKFQGAVTQVRLAATELQNVVTYTVIIEAENNDRKLFPGMTANVQIETAKRDGVARLPVDVLRYKPRGIAASATSAGGAAASGAGSGRPSPEERERRMAELAAQLKSEVGLSDEQIAKVREALAQSVRGGKSGGGQAGAGAASGGGEGGGPDIAQIRARMLQRTNEAIAAVVTPEQKPAFEAWKAARETTRSANVWVLGADGQPVSRQIRLGIADEQFVEVKGNALQPTDRVIVRGREPKK